MDERANRIALAASMLAHVVALDNRIKANNRILNQTRTEPRRNTIHYNLASDLTPAQFFRLCWDRGERPAGMFDDGWMWVDNGAALESEDYAVFAWERDGDDFIFRGQVRLMGGEDFVCRKG